MSKKVNKKEKTQKERSEAFHEAHRRLSKKHSMDFIAFVECRSRFLKWVINTFFKGKVVARMTVRDLQE